MVLVLGPDLSRVTVQGLLIGEVGQNSLSLLNVVFRSANRHLATERKELYN